MGLFRHGHMDAAGYALNVFDMHMAQAGLSNESLRDATILEMGPGDSIATAIIAYAYGARAILVDAGDYAKNTPESYRALCDQLAARELRVPDVSRLRTIDEILDVCDGRYLTSGLESWREIASESVDLVFSQAVLEHVRKKEFMAVQEECFRVMKDGAVASHKVDLRDHLGGALNNLRFSERVWESAFFVRSGFYTNRIQMNEMLAILKRANFMTQLTEVRRWDVLPISRTQLDRAFSALPDDDLNVSGFDVLLRRNKVDVLQREQD